MYSAIIDNFDVNTIIYNGISPISDLLGIIHYKKIGMKAYGQNFGQQLDQVNDNRKFLAKLELKCVEFVANHKLYSKDLEYCKNQHLILLKDILKDLKITKIKSIVKNDKKIGYAFVISDETKKIIEKTKSPEDEKSPFNKKLDHYISNKLPFNINVEVDEIKM